MSRSFDFKAPDLFTTGAVGPPGQRVFYLQAREAGVLLTLKVEKEQVGALAEYLASFLEKLPGASRGAPVRGDVVLVEPLVPAWAVRSLAVGYDEAGDRVVIVAEEQREDDDETEEVEEGEGAEEPDEGAEEPDEAASAASDRASARFEVSRAQAEAFVERARRLMKAGRPTCPFCSRPINPGGHVCPRQNGARRD